MPHNVLKAPNPHKESDRRYEIYCPFKDTPNDRDNAPIRFIFELTEERLEICRPR